MTSHKLSGRMWLYLAIAFVLGLVIGGGAVRWHYHHASRSGCGTVSYYDKDGRNLLYRDNSCAQ